MKACAFRMSSRSLGFLASKYRPCESITREWGGTKSDPNPTDRMNPSSMRTSEAPER
ncbi:hypothetical protein D3C77_719000 [compost metagenome]